MNKIVIGIFNNEQEAAKGLDKIKALHLKGDISLYAFGVFAKNADGKIEVKQVDDGGMPATGFGMLFGGLVGALAGPAGLLVGAALGGVGGSIADLYEGGVDVRFAEEVAHVLTPGKTAVFAHVDEEWTAPLDNALKEAGAMVYRRNRADIEEAQWLSDMRAEQAALNELEAEWKTATAERKAELQQHIDQVKQNIADKKAQWEAKIEQTKQEAEAKIALLKQQREEAAAERKAKIDARIEGLKADVAQRKEKLSQASDLVKSALSR